jgi:hypothetical protein
MTTRLDPTSVELPAEPAVTPVRPTKSAAAKRAVAAAEETQSAAGPPHDPALDKLRVSIARVIQQYFAPLFIVTLGCVLFLFVVISFGLFQASAINVMALAASVQVAFGMIIGFVCVYIGLMMTWFGIDAAYSLKGSFSATDAVKTEGALKSASPGLIFALGGMLLIAVSLYKPIVFEEKGGLPVHIGQMPVAGDSSSDSGPIIPHTPPPRSNSSE